MTDLEQTDELPALPTGTLHIRGSHFNHAAEYAKSQHTPGEWRKRAAARALFSGPLPASVQARLTTTLAVVTEIERIRKQPRSPLFHAALALLRQEPDQLAVLCRLADACPGATLAEVCQVLRETATLFAAAGVLPRDQA